MTDTKTAAADDPKKADPKAADTKKTAAGAKDAPKPWVYPTVAAAPGEKSAKDKAKAADAPPPAPPPPANLHPVNPKVDAVLENEDGSIEIDVSMVLNETVAKTFNGATVSIDSNVSEFGGYLQCKFTLHPTKSVDDVIAEDKKKADEAAGVTTPEAPAAAPAPTAHEASHASKASAKDDEEDDSKNLKLPLHGKK